jgi:hypothetical protein
LLWRSLNILLAVTGLLIIVTPIFNPSYSTRPAHYSGSNPKNERVFIAANIIDSKLIRGAWGKAVLELIDIIGNDNVFLSIYENDSGEDTRVALMEFSAKVKCKDLAHYARLLIEQAARQSCLAISTWTACQGFRSSPTKSA